MAASELLPCDVGRPMRLLNRTRRHSDYGNTSVVVISRWRAEESRNQPMLVSTESASEAIRD
jgi:hypothetical protein